jgi:hypothetical protein
MKFCEQLTMFWCNSDWSQFLSSIVATLFGFGLAIIGERIYDFIKDKSEQNILSLAFKKELMKIAVEMDDIDLKLMYIDPIKTPIWESSLSTNKVALLHKEIWYGDLFRCYAILKEYNDWHNVRTSLILNSHDNQNEKDYKEKITQKLLEHRDVDLCEGSARRKIQDLLNMMKG